MLKIDNGGGRWGFALRPVNEAIAWQHIQKDIDRELLFDFTVVDDCIEGTVGDKNSIGALRELPNVELLFKSLDSNHQKEIRTRLGAFLSMPISDFPDAEYSIQVTVPMDTGAHRFVGYLDEGVFHEKEPWTVPKNGIIELLEPRILDCSQIQQGCRNSHVG